MKKLLLIMSAALLIGTVGLQSCDKIKDDLKAKYAGDVNWDGVDVDIDLPASSDTTLHMGWGTGTFTYNLDSMIKSKTEDVFGVGDIDSFHITNVTMTIQNPGTGTNNNFACFQLGGVYFSTNANTTVVPMEVTNNPDAQSSVLLPSVPTQDIRSYIGPGSTTFTYLLGAKLRRATTTTLTVRVHIGYRIHIG